jgi:SAM-dependent methyltransferase
VADSPASPEADRSPLVRRAEARLVAARAHAEVARRFAEEDLSPVLDVGCGEGALTRALSPRQRWVGLDRSVTVLAAAPRPALAGDATALPFADRAFAGAAALYVMHHLTDPNAALEEIRRVLRRDGVIAVATVSRWDSPEFGDLLDRRSSSFDAEDAPAIVAGVFADIEVRPWDAPLVTLHSTEEIARYLIGRGVENATAMAEASQRTPPLPVTKRGCLVFGRNSV